MSNTWKSTWPTDRELGNVGRSFWYIKRSELRELRVNFRVGFVLVEFWRKYTNLSPNFVQRVHMHDEDTTRYDIEVICVQNEPQMLFVRNRKLTRKLTSLAKRRSKYYNFGD